MTTNEKSSDVVCVGNYVQVFEMAHELREMRRYINVELARMGEKHHHAAKRAGVTRVYWSRLVNKRRLTMTEAGTLARGLNTTPDKLIEACAVP